MLTSRDRILTTHVGSLPRNEVLTDLLIRREAGEAIDPKLMADEMDKAVADVTTRQKDAGIDIGNDGEQQRVGFQTYVPQRMSGFGGESRRPMGRDLKEFPELIEVQRRRFPYRSKGQNAPEAKAELKYLDLGPINAEVARFKTGSQGKFVERFMTAPSPGIIGTTMLNGFYDLTNSTCRRWRARCAMNTRRSRMPACWCRSTRRILQWHAPSISRTRPTPNS